MKRKSYFTFVLIAIFALGAILADNIFNFGTAKTAVSYVAPVGVVFSNIGESVSGFFGNIGNISSLQKENKDLNDKLNSALVEVARLSEAQKENDSLKNDLNFKKANKFDLVPANVIFFDPSNIRDTITVNAGTSDGLKEGDVVTSQGFLVGRITKLTSDTAKIVLVSDPASAVPVTIANSAVSGIVKGKIGGGLVLDQIPQSDKVNVGDMLVTSGLGGSFPKGLLLGKIENVQQISGSIFQGIEVRPMIDLGSLERVMIIRG